MESTAPKTPDLTSAERPRTTAHGDRTRRQILRRAVDIASAQGLEGLTIGSLAKELGMSKSGLFAHFGSKEELQLAVVDEAAVIFAENVVEPAFEAPEGVARLYALMDHWVGYVDESVFPGGCFWSKVESEFSARSGVVRDKIVELTSEYIKAMQADVENAKRRGELRDDADAAQLTFEFGAYVQGCNLASQLHGDRAAFGRARLGIRRRIEDAATDKGKKALAAYIKG